MEISTYGLSFVGRRSTNQDSITEILIDTKKSIYFFAVADGMGGAAGGEIASQTTIDVCKNFLTNYFPSNPPPYNLKSILENAIKTADRKLVEITEDRSELRGMGTTLTCILIVGDKYVVGNIGDSRTYYFNSQLMTQITRDHSAIEDYRQEHGKELDSSIAKQYGHLITRSMGQNKDEPDIFPKDSEYFSLKNATGFLLCSDGLLVDKSERDPTEFQNYCVGKKTLKDTVESLIGYAFHSGSTDNISVICVEIGKIKRKKISLPKFEYPPKETKIPAVAQTKSRKIASVPVFLLIGILIVGSLLIVKPWGKQKEENNLVTNGETEKINVKDSSAIQQKKPEIKFSENGFYPENNAIINISKNDELKLSWQIVTQEDDITYEVKYWIPNQMEEKSLSADPSSNSITLSKADILLNSSEGKLHWKVIAKHNNETVRTSRTRTIKIIK